MDKYLKINELEVGATYICKARNFTEGVWDGKAFNYMRTKWRDTFPDKEYHWDEGAPYGTVKPLYKKG